MSDAVPPGPSRTSEPPAPAQASLRQVAGAVFWSFFGVRKGKAMRDDAVSIRPHQVIVLGIVFAGLFVIALVTIVRIILKLAGAARCSGYML